VKVEKVKIGSLTADPENARKHSKRNIDAIAASLTNFGQQRPLVVWDNIIIAGNGTVEAAKSLGWTDISIVRVPADWTADQARAYALADNRTAELADWDPETLATQLIDLDSMGFNMADLGFTLNAEKPSDFLNGLSVEETPDDLDDDGPFVASEKYPLPYGFTSDQRETIIKAINRARELGEPDAPTALQHIATLYLESN
jgi:hypothetical protein